MFANRCCGAASLAVLWAIMILSLLAAALFAHLRPRVAVAARERQNRQELWLAEASVRRAIQAANLAPGDNVSTADMWAGGAEIFGVRELSTGRTWTLRSVKALADFLKKYPEVDHGIDFGLADEEGKLNVNIASREELESLFALTLELPERERDQLAAAIVDWRDPNNMITEGGAEQEYYSNLAQPYPVRNGKLPVLVDLLFVRGMTQEVYETLAQVLTVYGAGKVNLNTASLPVLQALGLDAGLARSIAGLCAGGDGVRGTADDFAFSGEKSIVGEIETRISLSDNQKNLLTGLVAKDRMGVTSRYFSGVALGVASGGSYLAAVEFTFERGGRILYRRERRLGLRTAIKD